MSISPVFSQSIAWEKRLGWSFTDELDDVISTQGDSVFIACGSSYYHGYTDLGGIHHWAITIIAFDANGDTLWHKPLSFYGGASLLCQGDSEGFYMVATSDFPAPGWLNENLTLFKISYNGLVLWQQPILGTNVYMLARKMIRTSKGHLMIVGRGGAQSPNLYNMFVIGVDTAGRLKFNERYTDHPRTFGNHIEETPDGTFLASGAAGSRIWAIEIDSMGREIQRQTIYQTPTRAILNETACVKQAPDGRFIATAGPLNYSPNFYYFGSYSAFSSTSKIWGGERTSSYALQPHINNDGSVVLYNGISGQFFLSRYNSDSSQIWNTRLRSSLSTNPSVINMFAYLNDSSAIAVGRMNFPSPNNDDYYFARIRGIGVPYNPGQPVAAKTRYKGLPALIAYPTPTAGNLTIHTRSKQPIQLTTTAGKVLETVQPHLDGTTEMDVRTYPAGLYFLKQGSVVVRVVKE